MAGVFSTPRPMPSQTMPLVAGAAVIGIGILIGWALGSTDWGFLVGAILGLPIGVYMTYKRYGHAL